MGKTIPLEERFWEKVDKSGDCWLWTGCVNSYGYGRINIKKKIIKAHRVSWGLLFGPIPKGLCILHKCDNPPCVNPDHLFLGTLSDNTKDMIAKGRGGNVKLFPNQVREIQRRFKAGEIGTILAKEFGVNQGAISKIITGRTWKEIK